MNCFLRTAEFFLNFKVKSFKKLKVMLKHGEGMTFSLLIYFFKKFKRNSYTEVVTRKLTET